MKSSELFDFTQTLAEPLLREREYPESALDDLRGYIESIGRELDRERYCEISRNVWVAKTANIAPSACIMPPCIIGEWTEVRHCAYIRGSALIGDRCVIGNSSEIKNSILFNRVQVPHFNYVGDSILGYGAHLGAGAVTSNVKCDRSCVCVTRNGVRLDTGRRKLGAMIGDRAEVGCGAVICPGSVIGRDSVVYPLALVRGEIPSESIYKGGSGAVKRVNCGVR